MKVCVNYASDNILLYAINHYIIPLKQQKFHFTSLTKKKVAELSYCSRCYSININNVFFSSFISSLVVLNSFFSTFSICLLTMNLP